MVNHRIDVLGICAGGKHKVFYKTLTLPSYLPIGYRIIFSEFSILVESADLIKETVVIRGGFDKKLTEAELLRNGFVRHEN